MAKVGLVLSGGMAKGAYQIGVLKAIDEIFNDGSIQYVSASSIGSLNAYAYATDKLKVAEEMWLDLKLDGISSFIKTCVRKPYIFNLIDSLVEEEDLIKMALYTTCFNITKEKLNYIQLKGMSSDDVRDYLKASISLPILTKPMEISNMKYFDGALIDNIPVSPLMRHNMDYIIVVHFDDQSYSFENEYFDNKLIKINFLDDKIIKNTLSFDRDSIQHMIDSGYEKSKTIFEMIFKNGIDDLDYIYDKIEFLNDLRREKQFRITGDIVLNNVNKLLKRLVPKNI